MAPLPTAIDVAGESDVKAAVSSASRKVMKKRAGAPENNSERGGMVCLHAIRSLDDPQASLAILRECIAARPTYYTRFRSPCPSQCPPTLPAIHVHSRENC